MELGEALINKEICMKSDRGTQLLNPGEDHIVGLTALDQKTICTNAVGFGCTVRTNPTISIEGANNK